MRIGIDFDNTIVCYDELFHQLAVERGLIEPGPVRGKSWVRDELHRRGLEADWTRLQGEAYGPRIVDAAPFPGVAEFFRLCRREGVELNIISHKTHYPIVGDRHDLHAAATGWLRRHGFFTGDTGLSPADVFFETTKDAKLARIASQACCLFIDDLPDILLAPAFPPGAERVLFAPACSHADGPRWRLLRSWSAAPGLLAQRVMT